MSVRRSEESGRGGRLFWRSPYPAEDRFEVLRSGKPYEDPGPDFSAPGGDRPGSARAYLLRQLETQPLLHHHHPPAEAAPQAAPRALLPGPGAAATRGSARSPAALNPARA